VAPPDFNTAARRHYKDAQFLLGGDRWPNADHLAGVAAECALKAILLGYFGVTLNQGGKPIHPQGPKKRLGHINELWGELSQIVSGRAGPALTALLAGPAPFATWDVADRYSDGSAITELGARAHVNTAKAIMGMLQQALLTGAVPCSYDLTRHGHGHSTLPGKLPGTHAWMSFSSATSSGESLWSSMTLRGTVFPKAWWTTWAEVWPTPLAALSGRHM
jgi:hypothetical protein